MEENRSQAPVEIKSLTLDQLQDKIKEMGLPAFRAKQIFQWLHQKRVSSFEEMTNLPADLRQRLGQGFTITNLEVDTRLVSAIDGTVKYLFRLPDGNAVESVLMKYKHGNSLCISTQVGCRMGCKFCASTLGGLVRNLTAAEMLEEVYTAEADSGCKVDSLVLMGIGEPLDNYENVMTFLELLSCPEGKNLSLRHVSLSTCGLVDKIDQLAEKKLGLTLSISLHACDNPTRSGIMPVNNRYNIYELLESCRRYFAATGRRVSFEYALISGVNDTPQQADQLAELLRGMNCHVNLIPVNSVQERGFKRGNRKSIEDFCNRLCKRGINATVRRELGSDINAACGQLRRGKEAERGQS